MFSINKFTFDAFFDEYILNFCLCSQYNLTCILVRVCGRFLGADLCGLFIILKVKILFREFAVTVIADDHALIFTTDIALVANI